MNIQFNLNFFYFILFIYLIIFFLIIKKNKIEFYKNNYKRIMFIDFWPGWDIHNNFFTNLFSKYKYNYTIVNNNPDILIYSVFVKKINIILIVKEYFILQNINHILIRQ